MNDTTAPRPASKVCACGCGKRFTPNRHWQKYLNKEHQTEHWFRTHPRTKVA